MGIRFPAVALGAIVFTTAGLAAQCATTASGYMTPPKVAADILEAAPLSTVAVSR